MSDYRSGCTGKVRYTHKEALLQVKLRKQTRKRGLGKKRGGNAYRCKWCGYYHVTHYQKTDWRRLQRRLRPLPELPDDPAEI